MMLLVDDLSATSSMDDMVVTGFRDRECADYVLEGDFKSS